MCRHVGHTGRAVGREAEHVGHVGLDDDAEELV